MKIAYEIIGAVAMVSALPALNSCEEFTPVFTGQYPEPEAYAPVEMEATHTIKQLAAMYRTEHPMEITDDIVIAGQVSTSDQAGNFYRSFYIQDETGGIEIKMGKTGLYNDYKPGQTVYVDCKGLWLGMYGYKTRDDRYNKYGNGMVQLGYEDLTGEYETSYIEVQYLIDSHIFRGNPGKPVEPVAVEESRLPDWDDTQADNGYIGKLITLNNLTYTGEIFALLYVNSNVDGDRSSNRVFLSTDDGEEPDNYNIVTWAMSEQNVKEHLAAGDWDDVLLGNGNDQNYGAVGDPENKSVMMRYASPASVSQYFTMPNGTEIQIRTSGYSRFADLEIPEEVREGVNGVKKTINATGVLTLYQGSLQLVLIDQGGIEVND